MALQLKSDVLDGLAEPQANLSVLERAFCSLVVWPQEGMILDLAGPEDAVDLLGSIATALADFGDTHAMPAHITAALEHEAARRGWSLAQDTYMSGASYVKAHLGYWRDVLHSAKTDGEAVGWRAEAHGDETITVRHMDGHRIVFDFAPERGPGPVARDVQWTTEGDHGAIYYAALRMALGIAKGRGWDTLNAGTITSGG